MVDHSISMGGGADKNCCGRLFISSMGQGQESFQISLHEKHRVALLTPDQKVANSIPGRSPSGMQNTPSCPVARIPSSRSKFGVLNITFMFRHYLVVLILLQ